DLAAAVQDGDLDGIRKALARHERVLRVGADAAKGQATAWRELRQVIQERTTTAAAEFRRIHALRTNVPAAQVNLLVRALLDICRAAVEAHLGREAARPILMDLAERALMLVPPDER